MYSLALSRFCLHKHYCSLSTYEQNCSWQHHNFQNWLLLTNIVVQKITALKRSAWLGTLMSIWSTAWPHLCCLHWLLLNTFVSRKHSHLPSESLSWFKLNQDSPEAWRASRTLSGHPMGCFWMILTLAWRSWLISCGSYQLTKQMGMNWLPPLVPALTLGSGNATQFQLAGKNVKKIKIHDLKNSPGLWVFCLSFLFLCILLTILGCQQLHQGWGDKEVRFLRESVKWEYIYMYSCPGWEIAGLTDCCVNSKWIKGAKTG